MVNLGELLSDEERASVRRPIESALTLPAKCFTDPRFLELEVQRIYQRHWVAVLFEFDLDSGGLHPFELCGIPLVAVCDRDGALRVFHNICPYDGCLAVIDPQKDTDRIVVPYHGWEYDLTGHLIRTPFWDGTEEGGAAGIASKQADLVEVNTEVFMKTVFVNLSADPQPFGEYVAPLVKAMTEYDLAASTPGLEEDGCVFVSNSRVKTNWKTHFENACINVLHENFVHASYSRSPEVPRIGADGEPTFQNVIDGNFMALGYRRRDFEQTYPRVEVSHLGIDPEIEPETETFGTLYPNFYVSASSQFIEVALALPYGPGETEQRACYHYQHDVACSAEAQELRTLVANGFRQAAIEDGRICEAVQKARQSPVCAQKFYAPFWDAMHHHFSNLILDDLEGQEDG